jgi:SAM-dependent methyltransferase
MIWPLPALLTWAASWAMFLGLSRVGGLPAGLALALATVLGVCSALLGDTRWRSVFIALGFPLSVLASGAADGVPGWAWLFPLAAVFALYPVQAWRDAPVYPTPRGALRSLPALVPLAPGARAMDAGCGLGDGLRELHAAYPDARLDGIEWSWPLVLLCGMRCRWLGVPATVHRADIWREDWSAFDLVYVFQRPESMTRAMAKAAAELKPGAWLASLEFQACGVKPAAVAECPDGRQVWLYRAPWR